MKAFHNDPKIKKFYLKRIKGHQKADEIIKGKYWEKGKGCAVGCTIHSSDHIKYEIELGIPMWLARLEDTIFEGLPIPRAKQWPAKFLTAITPGQDLDKIEVSMLIFIVESAKENFNHDRYPRQLKAIDDVLNLLKKDPISLQEIKKTRAAYAAANAADAAYNAGYAAANAVYAASNAAYAAANAVYAVYPANVAYVTAYAAANAAANAAAAAYAAAGVKEEARENIYIKFANKLLRLIKEN